MKLENALTLFALTAVLCVGTAVAAWQEPALNVISDQHRCTAPAMPTESLAQVDQGNLLLLMLGLQQGLRPAG